MAAGSESKSRPRARTGSEGATLVWLDSLAAGLCNVEAFLAAMRERYHDGEGNWEVLTLLDQYYRRGKLKPEVFQTVKSRLENSPLDAETPVKRPPDTVTAPAPAPRVVPAMTAPAVPATVVPSVTAPASTLPRQPPKPRGAVREVAMGDLLRARYRVTRVLGYGGMGTVFEALDEYRLDLPSSGQSIALKALHPAVTQREELLSELQREFQHLQSLSHPNIVRVHEFDRDGDTAFFTMELLSGALLSRVLNARGESPLPRPDALAIIRDIGAALSHAHSRGVVHGDVNPQNIFITNEGDLRMLDFGAAHKLPQDLENPEIEVPQRVPMATRGYASCELLEGQRPDARDDVFAFACVAYLLLSGRHPFPDSTALEARTRRVRPRRSPDLTGRQWRVLQEGLRWDRDRRPSDVQEWLDRFDLDDAAPHLPLLQDLVKVPPPRSRLGLSVALGMVLVAVLAAGGYWLATHYGDIARSVSEWRTPAEAKAPEAAVPEPPTDPAVSAVSSLPTAPPSIVSPPSTVSAPPTVARPSSLAQPTAVAPAQSPSPARAISASSRIELAADSVDVAAGASVAHVTIRRKGSTHGAASFTWWTESGTAKPGLDFVPVMPHVESIGDGQSAATLDISLSNAPRSREKSFYVVIDQAESGPGLGARTLTMVTMQPPDAP